MVLEIWREEKWKKFEALYFELRKLKFLSSVEDKAVRNGSFERNGSPGPGLTDCKNHIHCNECHYEMAGRISLTRMGWDSGQCCKGQIGRRTREGLWSRFARSEKLGSILSLNFMVAEN